ncbi:MAG: ankyrin repeat domain-containing protein [Saprospiraceae bacterium]
MRLIILSSLLFLTLAVEVAAQEDNALPQEAASNATDVLNMPSKWQKYDDDLRADFLFAAVERGDITLARTMLADVEKPYYRHNKEGETLLTLAVSNGHYEMVQWLCEAAVINLKNEAGETPLTLAIKSQQPAIIEKILERAKADLPNDQDETPLMLAVSYGYEPAFIKQLVDKGANPNRLSNGYTPLFRAVVQEQIPTAAMLVRVGADPSLANDDGSIALFQAVQQNDAVLAGVLLHRSHQPDTDANWQTPNGETLLNMALAQHNTDLLRVLVEKGADPNAVDYLENTPMHLAAERGMTKAVNLLLVHGAAPDPVNIMGSTPVMLAAQRGHNDIAQTLTSAGANPDYRDYAGVAARDFVSLSYSDPYLQEQVEQVLMTVQD